MFDNYGNNQATQPQPPPTPKNIVRFDSTYIQSTSGVLKLVQIVSFSTYLPKFLFEKHLPIAETLSPWKPIELMYKYNLPTYIIAYWYVPYY